MNQEVKDILNQCRKLFVLEYAKTTGSATKTCKQFGIARSSFYDWKKAYDREGESGLLRKKPITKSHPRKLNQSVVDKIVYLRNTYQLGSWRIKYYLERYQYTAIDDATRIRTLKIFSRYTQKNAIEFIDHVENIFPFRIHTIRTDRGHEFQARFHWHVEDKGMRHIYQTTFTST